MIRTSSALIWGVLFLSVNLVQAGETDQGDAVVRLLNLFAEGSDPVAIANAGKLLNQGKAPAEVVSEDLQKPLTTLEGGAMRALGDYVDEHPEQFPQGLPDAGAVTTPLRLGLFFDGLYILSSSSSPRYSEKKLVKVQRLLDDSWLDAAATCGAIRLQQLLIAHRGELGELLLSYQESQNDIALIILGETVANYPEALQTIKPDNVSTRTLAYLLSGTFAVVNRNEQLELSEIAGTWTDVHPELPVMLKSLRDPASLSWYEWHLQRKRGGRKEPVK